MTNEIKISFDAPRYYVDKSSSLVKCTLNGVLKVPEALAKSLGIPSQSRVASRGVSFCLATDKFDEYIGKKISLAKAENKAYQKALVKVKKAWARNNDEAVLGAPFNLIDFMSVVTMNSTINAFSRKANASIDHNKKYVAAIGK